MAQEISAADLAFSRQVARTMTSSISDTDEVIAIADRAMRNPDVRAFVANAAKFLSDVKSRQNQNHDDDGPSLR